jgi:hypothetical protein
MGAPRDLWDEGVKEDEDEDADGGGNEDECPCGEDAEDNGPCVVVGGEVRAIGGPSAQDQYSELFWFPEPRGVR